MTGGKKDYDVGYGKPPKHTRFRKGQSGNPGGRPQGARNFATDLDEILEERIEITEKGRSRKVTSQLAALKCLRAEALRGDARSLDRLLAMAAARSAEKEAQSSERTLTGTEAEILRRYTEVVLSEAGVDADATGVEGAKDAK